MEIAIGLDGRAKCGWCAGDALYERYHDEEWGYPIRDDQTMFRLLMLEGFQAGLSWITILRKRENFDRAFEGWDPERIAAYGPEDVERLSPLLIDHINVLGRYVFALKESIRRGRLRPLRKPGELDDLAA